MNQEKAIVTHLDEDVCAKLQRKTGMQSFVCQVFAFDYQ